MTAACLFSPPATVTPHKHIRSSFVFHFLIAHQLTAVRTRADLLIMLKQRLKISERLNKGTENSVQQKAAKYRLVTTRMQQIGVVFHGLLLLI